MNDYLDKFNLIFFVGLCTGNYVIFSISETISKENMGAIHYLAVGLGLLLLYRGAIKVVPINPGVGQGYDDMVSKILVISFVGEDRGMRA